MYDELYNFTAEPFRLSPDPRFCYRHQSFDKARRYMQYALKRAEGFIMVTGSPGTGKTTLVEDLVSQIKGKGPVVARLLTSRLKPDELLRKVSLAFGLKVEGLDKATLLHELEQFLIGQARLNRTALLIVDEAQGLSASALEELRLLTNLQQQARPLIQIFLVGQQELRDIIRAPGMEQFHQRMIAACHLRRLEMTETREYIAYRLQRVAWRGDPRFTAHALASIHHFSRGIPRRINQVCSRLLLHGAAMDKHVLEKEDVRLVVEELREESLAPSSRAGEAPEGVDVSVDAEALPPLGPESLATPPAPSQEATGDAPSQPATPPERPAAPPPPPPRPRAPVPPVPVPPAAQHPRHGSHLGMYLPERSPRPLPEGIPPHSTGRRRSPWRTAALALTGAGTVAAAATLFATPGLADTAKEWLIQVATELRGAAEERLLHQPAGARPVAAPAVPAGTGPRVPVTEKPPEVMPTPGRRLSAGDQVAATGHEGRTRSMGRSTAPTGAERGAAAEEDERPGSKQEPPAPDAAANAGGSIASGPRPTGDPADADRRDPASRLEITAALAPPRSSRPSRVPAAGTAPAAPSTRDAGGVTQVLETFGRDLEGMGVAVSDAGPGLLTANLREQIPFDFDSAEVRPQSQEFLDRLATLLDRHPEVQLRIVGYTDPTGPADYNQFLSELRAAAVGRHLVSRGVARNRLATEGRGGTAGPDHSALGTEYAYDGFRRIELHISSPP